MWDESPDLRKCRQTWALWLGTINLIAYERHFGAASKEQQQFVRSVRWWTATMQNCLTIPLYPLVPVEI